MNTKVEKNEKMEQIITEMEKIITEYKTKIRENLINTFEVYSDYCSIYIINQYLEYVDEKNEIFTMDKYKVNLETIVNLQNKIISNEQLNKSLLYLSKSYMYGLENSRYELYLSTINQELYEIETHFECDDAIDTTKKYQISRENLIKIMEYIIKIMNDCKNK